MKPQKIADGIYLIKVPFEDIYTSVFVIVEKGEAAVIDCATTEKDVDDHIIPAISEIGILREDVKYLLLTHSHRDHAGGAERFLQYFENARLCAYEKLKNFENEILTQDSMILDRIGVVHLPGHTLTSVGYFDAKTKTLLTGDCLQLKGVSRFVFGVKYKDLYVESMKKLLARDDIELLVTSHEYEPLGAFAKGREEIEEYLKACIEYA